MNTKWHPRRAYWNWRDIGPPNETTGAVVGGVTLYKKHAKFLTGYLKAVAQGLTGKEALLAGGRMGGVGGMKRLSDAVVVRRMENLLQLPDIQQALRNVYGEVGFTIEEAMQLHVDHIRGDVTKEELNRDGEVVKVKLPPNYLALKDYLTRTTPQMPHRMQVVTARMGTVREVRSDGSPPPMSARPIGDIIEGG